MSQPSAIINVACTELPKGNARACCKNCSSTDGYLARYIKQNGYVAIRWVCEWCEGYTTAGDLPYSFIPQGVHVGDLPLRLDNRPDDGPLCAVCESRDIEYHHWAPSAIFPDWNHVPAVALCVQHHREWHHRMHAHGLRYPHELAIAT